jgi:RecA-family ATPase
METIQKRPAGQAAGLINLNSHYIDNNIKNIEKQEELSFYFYQYDKEREEEALRYYFLYIQEQQKQQIIYQNKDKEIYIDNYIMFEKPEPLKFIFQGFRTETVGIFAGTGGVGKSYMALAFMLSFADTTERLNYLNLFGKERGKCGYISLEDDVKIIHHRLYNLHKYFNIKENDELLKNFQVLCLYGRNFKLADKTIKTIEIVKENEEKIYNFCKDKKFVIIDTLRRLSNLNENDSGDMSIILRSIENISFQTGCSILINSHTNKNNADGKDKVRGASSITDDTRFTLTLKKIKYNKEEAEKLQKAEQLILTYDKVNAIKIPDDIQIAWTEQKDKNGEIYGMFDADGGGREEQTQEIQEVKKQAGRPRGNGKAGEL